MNINLVAVKSIKQNQKRLLLKVCDTGSINYPYMIPVVTEKLFSTLEVTVVPSRAHKCLVFRNLQHFHNRNEELVPVLCCFCSGVFCSLLNVFRMDSDHVTAQSIHVLSSNLTVTFLTSRFHTKPHFYSPEGCRWFHCRWGLSINVLTTLHESCGASCFWLYILNTFSKWQLKAMIAKNTGDENSDLLCSGWWTNPATSAAALWLHFHREIKVSGAQTRASSSQQQIVSVFGVHRLLVTELLLHHVSSDSGMSTWKMLNP